MHTLNHEKLCMYLCIVIQSTYVCMYVHMQTFKPFNLSRAASIHHSRVSPHPQRDFETTQRYNVPIMDEGTVDIVTIENFAATMARWDPESDNQRYAVVDMGRYVSMMSRVQGLERGRLEKKSVILAPNWGLTARWAGGKGKPPRTTNQPAW